MAMVTMEVMVPHGYGPGQQMQVQAPDGQTVAVVIPPGMGPGSTIRMQYQSRNGGQRGPPPQQMMQQNYMQQNQGGNDFSDQPITNGDSGDGAGSVGCFVCIDQGKVGVVQTFGKYTGTRDAGCSIYLWPISTVKPISLATKQLESNSECKTKDNVTMTVKTAIQYRIQKERIEAAVFEIKDPQKVVRAEVDSILRSTFPTMDLDDAYAAKEKMNAEILTTLQQSMAPHGYEVTKVLITDLFPVQAVVDAMNEINAARRNKDAAVEKGEADKILRIKNSEADAESKRLSGVGMAQMRSAMAAGVQDSMMFMQESGMTAKESLHMMVMTQYLDTLKEFANGKAAVMVPHAPSAVKEMESKIRDGFGTPAGQARKRA